MLEADDNDVEPDAISILAEKKQSILIILLIYCGLYGFISGLLVETNPVLSFVIGLPITILVLTWCLNDAVQLDHRIGKVMRIGLIFFGYIAFPIYVFQTRGFIKGIKTLVFASLFFTAMIALMGLGMVITYNGE